MFGWFKRRKAYKMGYDVGAEITGAVEAHIEHRVLPAAERFVDVFKGQLGTIFNDPEHDPRVIARVEWDIFEENLKDFAGHMTAELNIRTYKYDEIIDTMNIRETIDAYIAKRIGDITSDMRLNAANLIPAAVDEIERREVEAGKAP